MSFILDALKKSEVERQRQAIPGLMDTRPLPPRAKFPLWALALIALLVVNLGVLAVVMTRSGAPVGAAGGARPAPVPEGAPAPTAARAPGAAQSAATASPPGLATGAVTASPGLPAAAAMAPAATNAPAPGAAGGGADHFSPMDAAPPVYAPEIPPAQDDPGTARRSVRSGSSSSSGSDTAFHRDARAPDPLLTDSGDSSDGEVLPSINEINLAGQPALADLHLDVHVYATKPSERFVYINMRKYREGATLAEGPVLERIRRDGVVLNYQGLRFVLPRQQ
jgi:general secretion pathway protein B